MWAHEGEVNSCPHKGDFTGRTSENFSAVSEGSPAHEAVCEQSFVANLPPGSERQAAESDHRQSFGI